MSKPWTNLAGSKDLGPTNLGPTKGNRRDQGVVPKLSSSSLGYIPHRKHMTPDWELFRLGRIKLLVTKPYPKTYARFALDTLTSFYVARTERAALYLVRPTRKVFRDGVSRVAGAVDATRVNEAVLEIQSEQVTSIRQTALLDFLITVLWSIKRSKLIFRIQRRVRHTRQRVGRALWKIRNRGKYLEHGDTDAETEPSPYQGPYFRRSLIRHPLPIHLSARRRDEAEELAAQFGIALGAKIVTLHVRESSQDRTDGVPEKSLRNAARRNARIETYYPAIDYLVSMGYTVVRTGDPAMRPVVRQGVIDLATSSCSNRGLLEIFCMMKAEFMLGSAAGPANHVVYLTNTPTLVPNCLHPILNYPVRTNDIYALKRVIDLTTGRELTLADMLAEEYILNWKDITRYEWIDTSSHEILFSVYEIMDSLNRGPRWTEPQLEYRQLVSYAADALWDRDAGIRKEGPDDGFIGDGRVARWFAERHLT